MIACLSLGYNVVTLLEQRRPRFNLGWTFLHRYNSLNTLTMAVDLTNLMVNCVPLNQIVVHAGPLEALHGLNIA